MFGEFMRKLFNNKKNCPYSISIIISVCKDFEKSYSNCKWIEKGSNGKAEEVEREREKKKKKKDWKRISENNENWFSTFWLQIVL